MPQSPFSPDAILSGAFEVYSEQSPSWTFLPGSYKPFAASSKRASKDTSREERRVLFWGNFASSVVENFYFNINLTVERSLCSNKSSEN